MRWDHRTGRRIRGGVHSGVLLLILGLTTGTLLGIAGASYYQNIRPRTFIDDQARIEEALGSVLHLRSYDRSGNCIRQGSGFVAFDDRTIVTNWHLIDDGEGVQSVALSIEAETREGETFTIGGVGSSYDLRAYDPEKDIAILQTRPTGLTPLTLGNPGSVRQGDPVVAIGYPLGITETVVDGLLSGRTADAGYGGIQVLLHSAGTEPGNSGGALFDRDGAVIGITTAHYVKAEAMKIAIPIDEVQSLYQDGQDDPLIAVPQEALSEALSEADTAPPHTLWEHLLSVYPDQGPWLYSHPVALADLLSDPAAYDGQRIRVGVYLTYWTSWRFFTDDEDPDNDLILYDHPAYQDQLKTFANQPGRSNNVDCLCQERYLEEGESISAVVCGTFQYIPTSPSVEGYDSIQWEGKEIWIPSSANEGTPEDPVPRSFLIVEYLEEELG